MGAEIVARCPVCRRQVKQGEPEFPFCSDRCRQADLGVWATEGYRIPGEPTQESRPDDEPE